MGWELSRDVGFLVIPFFFFFFGYFAVEFFRKIDWFVFFKVPFFCNRKMVVDGMGSDLNLINILFCTSLACIMRFLHCSILPANLSNISRPSSYPTLDSSNRLHHPLTKLTCIHTIHPQIRIPKRLLNIFRCILASFDTKVINTHTLFVEIGSGWVGNIPSKATINLNAATKSPGSIFTSASVIIPWLTLIVISLWRVSRRDGVWDGLAWGKVDLQHDPKKTLYLAGV